MVNILDNTQETKKEGTVFDNQKAPISAAPTSPIPEEFLTDEDLYPDIEPQSNFSGKKKQSMLIVIIGGVIVLGIVLLVLNILLKPKDNTTAKIKLTYWSFYEKTNVMQEMINSYKKLNPNIDIEFVLMDAKDKYLERLLARTNLGKGPDLFRFHNTWVPEVRSILAPASETIITSSDFKKDYYPVIAKDLIIGNQVIGMPLDIDGLVLVYNEKMLTAAGYGAPPTDWEQLWEMATPAKGITVKNAEGQIVSSGVALGTAENITHFSDIIALMFMQNGVDFKNIATDANAASVLETYASLSLSENNVWDNNQKNSIIGFTEEKVAMIFAPLWQVEVIKKINPDLNVKVAPVPQIKGGRKKNIASYWVEGVSKASRYQKEAWAFLKFLGERDNLTKLYDLQVKSGRIYGMAYPRVEMADLLLSHEYYAPLIKDAPILDSIPLVDRTYDNGIDDKLIAYLKDAINGMLQGASAQDVLGTMGSGFTQVYTEYQYDPTVLK